jgi:hypothetical protein
LQWQDDDVIGGADAAMVEDTRISVGAGSQHSMQRIIACLRGFWQESGAERERTDGFTDGLEGCLGGWRGGFDGRFRTD